MDSCNTLQTPGHWSSQVVGWQIFLLLLWQFLLAGWFCWQAGDATCRVFICFWGDPTMLVAWPPIGIDCVFLMAGAFHFLTFWLEKFLLFPLVGVVKICRQSKIICWNRHFNFNFFLEAGELEMPHARVFICSWGAPPP